MPPPMSRGVSRSGRFSVWHVLSLGLFLRALLPILGYFHTRDLTSFYTPDTDSYVSPTRELIAHHRFFSGGLPEILRTPGYPLLLIPGLLLDRLELVTISLQIMLSCLTMYMVYRTAQLLFECDKVAIVAAALYAIEPVSILYTSKLVTDTLFAALGMVWLYFLLKYLEEYRLRDLLISGMVLAASVYVRPIGYFLPLMVAAGLSAWALVNGLKNKQRLVVHIVLFIMVSMCPILIWQERNRMETGYPGFSGISAEDLYFYWAASVLADRQHVPYFEMQHRLGFLDEGVYFEHHPEQKTWPLGQRLSYMNREGKQILLSDPWTFARMHLKGTVRVIFDPGATEFLKLLELYPKQGGAGLLVQLMDSGPLRTIGAAMTQRPLLFWSNVLLIPLELVYLLCACVVLFSRRLMREPAVVAAVLTIAYYVGISGGPAPGSFCRFRLPAMPIICVLAGYGMYLVRSRLHSRVGAEAAI